MSCVWFEGSEKGIGSRGMHRIRNREIRGTCVRKASMSGRVDQSTLSWFGHMNRMDEGRLRKRICRADVNEVRRRCRPR